ncbi:MAG: 16S rRNA (cytidine(1402)-2'-O)-methyltransferase [Chloroflexi bacterium]|nr:16S rRNA (cytidine(1402)-2'-O)-methyltransferase [Chloroflexota bacterium]
MIYLVATPIGNLADISLRALETLRAVDVIACEDTRQTIKLLNHYQISKPLISFHAYNEARALEQLVRLHQEGKEIAVVTDAGTPGISDPGYSVVQRAIRDGIPLTMIPGPAAFVMALVLSGLPAHSFTFRGFPPRKRGQRLRFLTADREAPYTLIYYESPYRLLALLEDALTVFGDRRAAVANELTKRFEKIYRGRLSTLLDKLRTEPARGEYTIVIDGAGNGTGGEAEQDRPHAHGADDA